MNQQQFEENIRSWAEARNLLSLDSISKQGMYLIAEIGEAVGEHLKGNLPAMMLELGDILVVLQVMRLQAGIECREEPTEYKKEIFPLPAMLRKINRHSIDIAWIAEGYKDFDSGREQLEKRISWVYFFTRHALHEIGYTPNQARQAVWDKIANRTGRTVGGVFIKDAPSPELGWIPTAERPLAETASNGDWQATEDGDGEFLAAVPYKDVNYPGETLWWIRQCVIESGAGLCVVSDSYTDIAGWEIDDVEYFLPITPPNPQH